MKHLIVVLFVLGTIFFQNDLLAQEEKVFEYTGRFQTYVVPEGISAIEVELYGAEGGFSSWEKGIYPDKYKAGKGGKLTATLSVKPGDKLYIFVGGKGDNATDNFQGKGGFNGGGDGNNTGNYGPYCGGGGGGGSDIRFGGSELSNRYFVAGGGGGAAANYPEGGDHGGGGGENGLDGMAKGDDKHPSCGRGATQSAGGEGGQWPGYLKAEDGQLGRGGHAADSTAGGGGGGGYYGGGAGSWSGGGGGSSYAVPEATEVVYESNVNSGNGKVIIRPACKMLNVELKGDTVICHGDVVTLNARSDYGSLLTWNNRVKNGQPFMPWLGRHTYTVKSDNSKDCPYSIEIFAKPSKPVITASKNPICENESVVLEVKDMEGIIWDNGIKQGEAFSPPVGENMYTVERKGECSGKDTIIIKVNKVLLDASVDQIKGNNMGAIDLQVKGGSPPYKYKWMKGNVEVSVEQDMRYLKSGTYDVTVWDNIGCEVKAQYIIEKPKEEDNVNETGPQLEAETDPKEAFVTVSYPGAFEYKIENMDEETVITGHSVNEDVVDITKLPPGTYRVSLIFKQIKQYVTFVKH